MKQVSDTLSKTRGLRRAFAAWRELPACEMPLISKLEAHPTWSFYLATRLTTLLLFLCATSQFGCSNKMSQAESDSRGALRELGAFTSLDTDGIHVATLMMTGPGIQSKMDEAIPHVANMPYLTHLEATKTNLNDEHMKTVGGLKRLSSLVLSGTQVGDAGLKQVARRNLDTLYIDRTQITPAAMDMVGGMSEMKILDISAANVMSNLAPLSKLEALEWLVLEDANIDSSTVDIISDIKSLGRLSIDGSTISSDDLARLKSAKPSLMIDQSREVPAETASEESPEVAPN